MTSQVEIEIDKDLCTGCGICIKFCPEDVLAESDELNQYDNHFPEVVAKDRCIVCRRCELYCPDFAIEVEEEES
ncbi:MAG: 4Fe-4S binding protein [Candidatus Thermoplasmatota archaeon]|nr:4Fe-4S binding protein [Candidatus Thermoplasmatota archaeon]